MQSFVTKQRHEAGSLCVAQVTCRYNDPQSAAWLQRVPRLRLFFNSFRLYKVKISPVFLFVH